MQSEEVGFQSAFERGQRLGCSDVHRTSTVFCRNTGVESSNEILKLGSHFVCECECVCACVCACECVCACVCVCECVCVYVCVSAHVHNTTSGASEWNSVAK